MSARDNILGRIRGALGRKRPMTPVEASAIGAKLRDHPRGPRPAMNWEPVSRFRERCLSLSSTVDEVASLEQVPAAVARYLAGSGLERTGVCWPEYAGLDWAQAGLSIESRPARGDDKIGITGIYCAIAETGTLMLLSAPDTHPVTSLLPETHIAIVPTARILVSMEDGLDLLRRERTALPRQVAFVSGPSRTADIEMTLVLGIHGPYRVHIVLVTG
jgi:L-lactate dehydrogenase complex protein LldG